MDYSNPMFLIPITTGPIFIITGLILLKFPPKKINFLYGYRTRSSMKSQERGNFSQEYSAKEMIKSGSLLTLICLIGLAVDINEGIGTVFGLVIMTLMVVLLLIRTEKAIKFKFGKE